MRENRPYGLEGGESGSTGLPYPYQPKNRAAATGANMRRLGSLRVLIYTCPAAGLPQTPEP